MSVDLSDEDIYPAFESVLQGDNNWLLLRYATRDKLYLAGTGNGSVAELRAKLEEDDVFFGFCHIEDAPVDYVLFAFVPEGIAGVKRARALVHGRAVASMFQIQGVPMNFLRKTQVTSANIRAKIAAERATSMSTTTPASPRDGLLSSPANSASTSRLGETSQSNSVFMPDVKEHQIQNVRDFDALPPPTPPKARVNIKPSSPVAQPIQRRVASEASPHIQSVSSSSAPGAYGLTTNAQSRQRSASSGTPVRRIGNSAMPLDEDPEFQDRLRAEIRRLREQAEREMAEAEAEANRIPRVAKKHVFLEDPEEVNRRKYEEEKEKQRRIAQRLLREQQWKEEAEREERERRERLALERKRRLETARQAQELRARMQKEQEQQRREEEARQKRKEAMVKAEALSVQKEIIRGKDPNTSLYSGWMTVQIPDSVTWRRRYFELTRKALNLYKDDKKSKIIEVMSITGRIAGIKEWDEGFEELRVIEHSFAVVFRDSEPPWLFFADNEQDKRVLASTLIGL